MQANIPLLFFSFIFYGSLPLVLAASHHSLTIIKRLALLFGLNLLGLACYFLMQSDLQMRIFLVFWDSFICFLVCMGIIAYGLPSNKPLRDPAFKLILLNFAVLLFFRLIYLFLKLTVHWHPITYDPLLYQFDASLGFSPSAVIAKKFLPYLQLSYFVYASLPLAFFVVCAHYYWRQQKLPGNLIQQCFWLGVIAWFLYNLIPAVGPVHAFPQTWLVSHLPVILQQTMLLDTQQFPRNCMPSLHVAWIYLLWRWPEKSSLTFRLIMLCWLLLTFLATLTTGEHYLIDLLLGIVFAVFMRALCQKLYLGVVLAVIVYTLWMFLILHAVNFLTQHFYWNYLLWLATLLLMLMIDHALPSFVDKAKVYRLSNFDK